MVTTKFRERLLASTMIGGVLLFAVPAQAQAVAVAAADAAADDSETIIVTGSRIASPTLVSPTAVQIVDAKAIQSTGAANLQDVLLQNPVFGTPSISRTNSNFQTSGAGLATVDLRNLGNERTLVLVNGRRFVSGSPNDQAVDLNSIPTSFISRVEINTAGASSLYGSDAVAGVVNIIYKTDFEGIEANGQFGASEEGDNLTRQVNVTIGGNFGEGKGNVTTYIGYSREGSVLSRDRKRSAIDQTSTGAGVTGDINDLFKITTPFFSSFAPQGRFFSAPGVTAGTFDKNNNFITGFSINGTPTRAADGYNRSQYRTIAVPVERYLIATRANYEITPGISAFLEGTFAKSHTETVLEPFAINTAGTNGIFQGTGGQYPVEQRLPDGTLFVNPLVPAALLARLTDTDGDGLRDVAFTRRLTDIGNRGNVADRTTYRVVGGIQGDVFDNFHYDAYYSYGRTDDNQTSTGQVNLASFRSALVVLPGPNGTLVCADPNAAAQGCVPANVYGANTLNTGLYSGAAAYVRADGNRTAFAAQTDIGANLSGELGDYWGAGPIGIAIGAEYRKEASAAAFDALQQAGLNGGNAIPNTSGRFHVEEGYAEVRVPLVTDKPFFTELAVSGAGRVSKYSTVGTVYSWNYGGVWAPVADIRFRVNNGRSTRAPNVSELYQGASQTFPTGLIDPCVGVTATTTGTLATTCRSFPGVNANIAANGGAFAQTQSDLQGISGFDTGNPNLNEERSDTLTGGVIIAPKSIEFLRNFTFTADYTRTRIKGAIVSTPRQFILGQCFNAGDPAFCQFVTRRAVPEGSSSPGSLQFVNSGASNSGGVFQSTLDLAGTYSHDLDFIGVKGLINFGVYYTHVFKFYQIPLPGAPKDDIAGEIGAAKDRFLLTTNLRIGGFSLEYRGTYIGRSYLDDQFVTQFTETINNVDVPIAAHDPRARVKAYYTSDLQGKFDVGDHFEFYLGVTNLFDKAPPPIYSNLPSDQTGSETDSGTYDAIGRRFYAGARLKF